ncbi:MAG: bifunctional phosphopantothenoylcysteine decarboxylase/phosphopantothenate--cysteine ligase CoaBC [Schwartzia sp. (in: firmicutes)]
MLEGKKIVLGVTGGIAAYKAVEVASRLRQAGAEVHVIMTKEAAEFVTALTFREITGQPVAMDMFAEVTHWNVAHVALAHLADAVLIAPATANIIAKAAVGLADDMLSTTLLATTAPLFFAPAMNTKMYEHPVVQENLKRLEERGAHIIPPACGHLACGDKGAGRLPEPETLVSALETFFGGQATMTGVKVLVTAAGTLEPIDPVRYIGNHSSGKMGYAIAAEAVARGASVVLVSGPSALTPPAGLAHFIPVRTALQMRDAVLAEAETADLVIKAAAVADYRVSRIAANKIKKDANELTLHLEKNPDILWELGQRKRAGQVLVGFAAETQNLLAYAREKLEKKNLDFIVANDVSRSDAGFNAETNLIKLLDRAGQIEEFPLLEKRRLAALLLDRVWSGRADVEVHGQQ